MARTSENLRVRQADVEHVELSQVAVARIPAAIGEIAGHLAHDALDDARRVAREARGSVACAFVGDAFGVCPERGEHPTFLTVERPR